MTGLFRPPPKAYIHHGGTEARRATTETKSYHELLSVTSGVRECGSGPQ
jgi:hypothetical protein